MKAKPTEKSEGIDNLLTSIAGISRQEALEKEMCTWCKEETKGFRDSISAKEYRISGMCQDCQDKTYGP